MFSSDVIIIGGGVVGLSSAWRLSQQGVKVTLLERKQCGTGASMASLGALMPYNPSVENELANQQRESLWSYPMFAKELFEETGVEIKYTRAGRIQPIYDEQQYRRNCENVEQANVSWPSLQKGNPMQILTQDQVMKKEPELAIGEYGALYCRNTSHLCPRHLIMALRSACMKNGVQLFENAEVYKIVEENGMATGVLSSAGPFYANKVIIAAGAWSKKLWDEVPVEPLRGHAMFLQTNKKLINHLIRSRGLYIAQVNEHRIMLGASKDKEAGFDDVLDEDIISNILNKAENIIPGLAESQIEKTWVGFRPSSNIKNPVVSQSNTTKGVYISSGHGGIGICMTPIVGKQVCEMILSSN